MSILAENENGWIISHEAYFDRIAVSKRFRSEGTGDNFVKLNPRLFEITDPFVKKTQILNEPLSSTSKNVKDLSQSLIELGQKLNIFKIFENSVRNEIQIQSSIVVVEEKVEARNLYLNKSNKKARETAAEFFDRVKDFKFDEHKIAGLNLVGSTAFTCEILNHEFIIPGRTEYYCQNVEFLNDELSNKKFDLIVMDPPWWNKYIRRRKRKQAEISTS